MDGARGKEATAADTRVDALDWAEIAASLDGSGCAATGPLLTAAECAALVEMYADPAPARFRKRVTMQNHGYGQGEYQYFAYPLPPFVEALRHALYRRLVPVARRWHAALGRDGALPDTLDAYLARCHAAGQARPTPLLLRYGAGDYNRLHQDLYGDLAFPMQAVFLLSRPGADFEGGEFVLVEQRPRMQSRAEVVPLRQGEAVIFAVNDRPVPGKRGALRVKMRHGVSRLR
ncbi:MAG: 2OG-Fe(II) oxygenase, partial [Rhodospirillaceae bacterium]|nr:2OG-Fe(II) oxygenase [Rhodospirillaceae bacterium]